MTVTTFDPDCIHGLDPAWCSICLQRDPDPDSADDSEAIVVIYANYASDCGACDTRIERGDWITLSGDGLWEHQDCP